MLSLNRCREILGADERLSDQEVEHVRGQLYAFAEVAVSVAVTGDRPAVETLDSRWTAAQAHLTEDERAEVEERAAILEVDAGWDRDVAEREAISQYVVNRKRPRKRT